MDKYLNKIIHADCMDIMAEMPDKCIDLAIVDPPYGINININMGLRKNQRKRFEQKKWDNNIPDEKYFIELFRISKNQIIWGGNYFPLGTSKCIIWWEKETPRGMSFSDGELAWTSFDKANKSFKKRNITNDKIHPTQKPIALYRWLLMNYAKKGDLILDTHSGSASLACACHIEGFNFIAFEKDYDYWKASVERFNEITSQGRLF